MPNRKKLGIDLSYIAPCDPALIPPLERVKNAERVQTAVEELHTLFPKYEPHIFMSALINAATLGAVAVGMEIEDLLKFTATCYHNAKKVDETCIDKE